MAYINQCPKEITKQSAAFKKKYPDYDSLPAGYTMQPKFDGCHLIVVVPNEGPAYAVSRTGEPVRSLDHIVEQCAVFGRGSVIFGEAYAFNTPFPTISGRFRQHAPTKELFFVAFDYVPAAAFLDGLYYPTPYRERLERLRADLNASSACTPDVIVTPDFPVDNVAGWAVALKKVGGYDGAILRNGDSGWQAGDSKQGEVMKVKPVESLDLHAHGWFPGKGKHAGRAGGIYVEYNKVQTGVGTGFSDAEREALAAGANATGIAEVEFMGFTDDGLLREPRFKGWRHDKLKAD